MTISIKKQAVIYCLMLPLFATDVFAWFVKTPRIKLTILDSISGEPIKNAAVVTDWTKSLNFSLEGSSRKYARKVGLTDKNGHATIPTQIRYFTILSEFSDEYTHIFHPCYEIKSVYVSKAKKKRSAMEVIADRNSPTDKNHSSLIDKGELEMTIFLSPLRTKYENSVNVNSKMTEQKEWGIGNWVITLKTNEFSLDPEMFSLLQGTLSHFEYFEWTKKRLPQNEIEQMISCWKSLPDGEYFLKMLESKRKQ